MKNMKYDYLIVGAGLFGATFAYRAKRAGKRCLVIDRRSHLGGNIFCENIEGINVHKYGAHIFHTSNKEVWEFVNSIVEFNRYTNSPIANYKGKQYNLPFNMNTFYQMWGVLTPEEAKAKIEEQRAEASEKLRVKSEKLGIPCEPQNLEEQALLLVGKDIYEILIKGYTEKQWGRKCTELPAFIIKRLPVRFIHDNNYFNDRYQGIPMGGYTQIIEKMFDCADILLNVDFFDEYNLSKYKNSIKSGETFFVENEGEASERTEICKVYSQPDKKALDRSLYKALAENTGRTPETAATGVRYGTQVLVSSKVMAADDPFFAGYKPVMIKSGKYYKYIVGVSSSQAEAKKMFTKIQKSFPDAFLVKLPQE